MSTSEPIEIETVEMHTGGEPVRIVTAGYPPIPGATILDKRRYARTHLDRYRRLLMHEPRGHHDMYGVLLVEPDLEGADLAALFVHNEGYSTMCGHAMIALGRYAVEAGLVPAVEPMTTVRIQAPCGLLSISVSVAAGRVGGVAFRSVPAFAHSLDVSVPVPGHGIVPVDIAYGGAFYAVVPAERLGLAISAPVAAIVDAADAVTRATAAAVGIAHPTEPELSFLYGSILTDGGEGEDGPTTNCCVFAEREVDRSPTGSGVTARLALLRARGAIAIGEERRFRSVVGSEFTGRVVEDVELAGRPAIVAEVGGRAFTTGRAWFTLEADDPFPEGFVVR